MLYIVASFLQRLFWMPVMLVLLILGYSVEGVQNLGKIPKERGLIIVSNHTTEFDPFYIAAIFSFFARFYPVHFVALKREEYNQLGALKHLSGGLLFKMFGAYPAILGQKDFEKALPNHIKLLNEGRTVAIFPEGGLNRTDELMKPAKAGVSYLAWRTNATILPVAIKNTSRITPVKGETHKKLPITAVIGEPFHFDEFGDYKREYNADEHKAIAQKILDRVGELFK